MTNQVANSGVAAGGGTVAIAWLWNTFLPAYPMPAEVAAGIAPLVGGVIAWLVNVLTAPKAKAIE